jgi:hypothetical protein
MTAVALPIVIVIGGRLPSFRTFGGGVVRYHLSFEKTKILVSRSFPPIHPGEKYPNPAQPD